jgi:thymidylate synthase
VFQTFKALTADDAWQQVADQFRCDNTGVRRQASRAGETREILHACVSISDPRQRWIASRMPPLNIAFALAEVIWIVRGRNDSAFVNYFSNAVRHFAGEGPTYHGAYGYRLRNTFGVDQLERARATFVRNPDSRQVVLQRGRIYPTRWDARLILTFHATSQPY